MTSIVAILLALLGLAPTLPARAAAALPGAADAGVGTAPAGAPGAQSAVAPAVPAELPAVRSAELSAAFPTELPPALPAELPSGLRAALPPHATPFAAAHAAEASAALAAASSGSGALPGEDAVAAPQGLDALLARRPLGFDAATLRHVERALADAPARIARVKRAIVARGRALGPFGSAALLLLVATVALTALGQVRLGARVEATLEPEVSSFGRTLRRWVLAAGQVTARTLPPLVLWLAHSVLVELTGFRGAGFLFLGRLLLGWSTFALVVTSWRELLCRPLLPLSASHARYLWGVGLGASLYALLAWAALEAVGAAGVRPDVVALLRFVSNVAYILVLTAFASRKRAVMALLPDLPSRPWRFSVRALSVVYAPVVVFTAGLALLAVFGWENLASFLWIRSWALAGIFAATVLGLHALHRLVHRWTGGVPAPGVERRRLDDAGRLARSANRLLDYLATLGSARLSIHLVGLTGPLTHGLSVPFLSLAERRVSALMLLETSMVAAGFLLASRVVRDWLIFRLYPALELDDAIARAIDTFVAWTTTALGVVIALEWAGLGVGTITVFAGALGIGLGFGMQALASNVASGLLLIFGRALRRGDWVSVGDTIGVIEDVGMRATRVRTADEIDVIVPNTELVTHPIVNWTGSSPLIREHVPVKTSSRVDPERVRAVLLAVAGATAGVERLPPPEVLLGGLTDALLEFELLVWIDLKQRSRAHVRSELYFAVLGAFRDAGIEIPQPERQVHVRSVATAALEEAWKLASIDPVREARRLR